MVPGQGKPANLVYQFSTCGLRRATLILLALVNAACGPATDNRNPVGLAGAAAYSSSPSAEDSGGAGDGSIGALGAGLIKDPDANGRQVDGVPERSSLPPGPSEPKKEAVSSPGATSQDPRRCEPGAHSMFSVYVGNNPDDLIQFERWMGRPVDAHQVHTGVLDWADWSGSISWQVSLWRHIDRRIMWSIPLIPFAANLADAAAGQYDHRYADAARVLVSSYPNTNVIHVRTGWEFNAGWMPWSAIGRENEYIKAFRRFVTAFRSVSNRFVFEWAPNIGDQGMNPENAYPGNDFVDVIGLDFYYNTAWDPADAQEAWKRMVTQKYGLQWHQDFARRHAKPTAYAEWGVMSDQSSDYVRLASEWFRQHEVVYHNYWNSNADFRGKLSSGQYPSTGRRFQEEFASQGVCAQ